MKKLKLSLSNMEGVEVLSREQLKMVMGGDSDGSGPTGGNSSNGRHSCCIRGIIPNSTFVMVWDPIQVSSQTECSQAAAAKVAQGYTNVHYDTDCDEYNW